ncbi:Fatty acid-binding protein, adipocyte, partial [Trichinella sp. T9]
LFNSDASSLSLVNNSPSVGTAMVSSAGAARKPWNHEVSKSNKQHQQPKHCRAGMNKVAMAEKFIGKYRFVSSENFDEFMKALGVNYLLRKIANAASPIVELSLDRDVWTLRNISTFRTLEISFRLGEEVDEVTPDGRHVKVKHCCVFISLLIAYFVDCIYL